MEPNAGKLCEIEDTKAIYYYTCKDKTTKSVTNGSMPWCESSSSPPPELVERVKVNAFRDLYPNESTTTMNADNLDCQMISTPIKTYDKIEKERI